MGKIFSFVVIYLEMFTLAGIIRHQSLKIS
jgi:hypothetical protein